ARGDGVGGTPGGSRPGGAGDPAAVRPAGDGPPAPQPDRRAHRSRRSASGGGPAGRPPAGGPRPRRPGPLTGVLARPGETVMLVAYNVDVPIERLPVANWVLIAVTCFCSLGILYGPHPDKARKHRDLDPHHIDWDQLEREAAEDEIPPMSLRRAGFSASQLL